MTCNIVYDWQGDVVLCCKNHAVYDVLEEYYDDEDCDIVMVLGDDMDIDYLCQDVDFMSLEDDSEVEEEEKEEEEDDFSS